MSSTNTSAIAKSKNKKWLFMYNRLKKYYIEEGHTNVPKNDILVEEQKNKKLPKLGRWCCNQRCLKRKDLLLGNRIKQLNKLNFIWEPLTGKAASKLNKKNNNKKNNTTTNKKKRKFADFEDSSIDNDDDDEEEEEQEEEDDDVNDDDDDDEEEGSDDDDDDEDEDDEEQGSDDDDEEDDESDDDDSVDDDESKTKNKRRRRRTVNNTWEHYLLYYKWDIACDKKTMKEMSDYAENEHDDEDDNVNKKEEENDNDNDESTKTPRTVVDRRKKNNIIINEKNNKKKEKSTSKVYAAKKNGEKKQNHGGGYAKNAPNKLINMSELSSNADTYAIAVHKRGGKNYRYRTDDEKRGFIQLYKKSKYYKDGDNISAFVDKHNVGLSKNDYNYLVVNSLRNWIKKMGYSNSSKKK